MDDQTAGGVSGGLSGAMSGAAIGSIVPGIGTIAGGVVGGLAGGLGGFMGGKKIKTPAPPTGKEMGQSAKDYFDTLAPGTTPWERIGANNPAGGVAQSTISSNTQSNVAESERKLQYRQMNLNNSISLADLANRTKMTDIEKQKVDNDSYRAKLEGYLADSKKQQNENSSIPSAFRTLGRDVINMQDNFMDIMKLGPQHLRLLLDDTKNNFRQMKYKYDQKNQQNKGRKIDVRNFN